MFEYKVVELELSAFGLSPDKDFQSVVNDQEREGWEFVQINPSNVKGYGIPAFFPLLFKRKKEESRREVELSG